MSDSAEWLRNLARNYADGVAGMEPQDHRAWEIADKIEQLREAWEHSNLIIRELRRSREWLQADNKRLQTALEAIAGNKLENRANLEAIARRALEQK